MDVFQNRKNTSLNDKGYGLLQVQPIEFKRINAMMKLDNDVKLIWINNE